MNQEQVLQQVLETKNVKFLSLQKFGYLLAPGQEEIVRKIAFREKRRISVSAMTRYGKTQAVAIAVALMIDMTGDDFIPKVAFIGPKAEQAGILRQYMADLITKDKSLLSKALLNVSGDKKLVKEASKKRMVFSNGAEYRVFSAEGDANRLMGFGANVIIPDEACLIGKEPYIKIMRMLGDAPKDAMFVELYNPWTMDSRAYEHSLDPEFDVIRIDYHQAIREGRTTVEHIEEMKKECGGEDSLEFTVLYKSEFPQQSEDAIFNMQWIRNCQENKISLWNELKDLKQKLAEAEALNPTASAGLREQIAKYRVIIACDPADKGKDKTVIWWGVACGNQYQVCGWYYETVSDNMAIASKILEMHRQVQATHWHIDGHGLGVGVLSRLRQLRQEHDIRVSIKECMFGGSVSSMDSRIYANQKALNYFRLRNIVKAGNIDLPKEGDAARNLSSEMMKMRWKKSASEKTIIVDPEDKSPDFCDALVYFIWDDKKQLVAEVI